MKFNNKDSHRMCTESSEESLQIIFKIYPEERDTNVLSWEAPIPEINRDISKPTSLRLEHPASLKVRTAQIIALGYVPISIIKSD